MKNQVLTIDQCKELVALGLDMKDASMYWSHEAFGVYTPCVCPNSYDSPIPTYTLQDILEKLPKSINITYSLRIQCYNNVINFGYWKGERTGWLKFCQDMNSTINSAFELLKWCLENKHIQL